MQLPKVVQTAFLTLAVLLGGLAVGLPIRIANQTKAENTDVELLPTPWRLAAPKDADEKYQDVDKRILTGKKSLKLTYDLYGSCILHGDASAVIFDQEGWKYISLADYGQNCFDGEQVVEIPLGDFKDVSNGQELTIHKQLDGPFHTRFWLDKPYVIEIKSAVLIGEKNEVNLPADALIAEDVVQKKLLRGIKDGQTVSDKIYVYLEAAKENITEVDFYIDNNFKTSEKFHPFYLGGDISGTPSGWNTREVFNGTHTLKVEYKLNTGEVVFEEINFVVDNAGRALPTPTSTPIPTVAPTKAPVSQQPQDSSGWKIRSVDAMKDTKDAICGQRPQSWIEKWADKAVELGANYAAISTPYENPSCGNAQEYTKIWIRVLRSKGLKIWHRQMPLAFEGIYNTTKNPAGRDVNIITNYIKANATNYQPGDIFTPVPEPQNGGISGISHCAQGYCQFSNAADFNAWLRLLMTESANTFESIGLGGKLGIGYFGFDGFIAWGANNPDWNGILEDATVAQMGNITIDHYPEAIGSSMKIGLDELQARYPGVPIVIGEWGTIQGGNIEQQVKDTMGAAKRPGVMGFNYWQFGPHGAAEQLINDDFTNRVQFDEVQFFYKNQ